MQNTILCSDLHLTTLPRDEYRWEFLLWLARECKRQGIKKVLILGDLTDAKDHHSSMLVNQIVQALTGLIEHASLDKVVVLRGNHDGVDSEWPYFRFLNEIPKVEFIWAPTVKDTWLFLPHSRNPEEEWQGVNKKSYTHVFLHATVDGAEAESGRSLRGVPATFFSGFPRSTKIYSGDVHVPQKVGRVEYVGAPYPIRFGDTFKPRVVYIDARGNASNGYPPHLNKRLIEIRTPKDLSKVTAHGGDQAKVRIKMERSEFGLWSEYKKTVQAWATRKGIDLVSLELVPAKSAIEIAKQVVANKQRSKSQLFLDFCKHADIDNDLKAVGKELL